MEFAVGEHVLVISGPHFACVGTVCEVKEFTYVLDLNSRYVEVRKDSVQKVTRR